MDEKEEILIENFNEYFDLGLEAFEKKKYNSAATLFFKAIAALCDIFILRKEGFIPSSHSNRFRTLEEKHPEVYDIADKDFPFIQGQLHQKIG